MLLVKCPVGERKRDDAALKASIEMPGRVYGAFVMVFGTHWDDIVVCHCGAS